MAERKIGNDTYRCDAMPAGEAINLLADLSRVLGQGIERLPGILLSLDGKAEGEEGAGQIADIGVYAAVGDILQANSSADITNLVERVVKGAKIKRPSGYSEIDLDSDFTGNLGALLPVAGFVLETTFGPFFVANAASGPLSRLRAAFQGLR